jgi:hypothetical protein
MTDEALNGIKIPLKCIYSILPGDLMYIVRYI